MECSVPPVSGGWCTTISVFDLTKNEVDGKGGGRDGYLPPFSTSLQCTPADPRTAATTVIGSQLSLPLLGPSPFEITLSHRNHGPSAYIQNRKGRQEDRYCQQYGATYNLQRPGGKGCRVQHSLSAKTRDGHRFLRLVGRRLV